MRDHQVGTAGPNIVSRDPNKTLAFSHHQPKLHKIARSDIRITFVTTTQTLCSITSAMPQAHSISVQQCDALEGVQRVANRLVTRESERIHTSPSHICLLVFRRSSKARLIPTCPALCCQGLWESCCGAATCPQNH